MARRFKRRNFKRKFVRKYGRRAYRKTKRSFRKGKLSRKKGVLNAKRMVSKSTKWGMLPQEYVYKLHRTEFVTLNGGSTTGYAYVPSPLPTEVGVRSLIGRLGPLRTDVTLNSDPDPILSVTNNPFNVPINAVYNFARPDGAFFAIKNYGRHLCYGMKVKVSVTATQQDTFISTAPQPGTGANVNFDIMLLPQITDISNAANEDPRWLPHAGYLGPSSVATNQSQASSYYEDFISQPSIVRRSMDIQSLWRTGAKSIKKYFSLAQLYGKRIKDDDDYWIDSRTSYSDVLTQHAAKRQMRVAMLVGIQDTVSVNTAAQSSALKLKIDITWYMKSTARTQQLDYVNMN